MARWEPNTRERLVRAAVDLFAEQGYDATTVSEIAERAGGLTKMTFFRHFPDKREVLFAGQEAHGAAAGRRDRRGARTGHAAQAVAAALDALAAPSPTTGASSAARLRAVIAGNASCGSAQRSSAPPLPRR